MYVCLCHNVTDTKIRHLVRTEGVSSMRELREQLGVATQCGKCAQCAKHVLNEALADMPANAGRPGLMAAA
ncbi:bacterioferritin-associated ferredoxin [Thiobacillus sp.]|uniref:bacterioferritin-associated ferredoxin n=1 Tax=Thiobacillus sp. TaxID=924 RepID=UPI0025E5AA80|nr:bacterioferritin-associated ferredoxin [Thiobacillus sp.]MBT9538454.1 bacterioferritin-associated ferredoxin [Thiobacillus sp.]